MTAGETATLWQKLTAAGLAQGTLPPPTPPGQAWYIRAMLVLSGWLAAVFLLLFLGFLSVAIFDKPAVALVLGICIFAGAYAMMRHAGQGDFLQQLSLATALAGKVLFLYGLARLIQGNIAAFWIQMAAVEIILIVALPSYIHRVGVLVIWDANKCDWCELAIGHRKQPDHRAEFVGILYWSDGESDDPARMMKRALKAASWVHPVFNADES